MAPARATIVSADTVTKLPPAARDGVVVSASHGGLYPGYLAAKSGVRAVILNDAGIGRDEAGIAALAYLAALGIPAACVSHLSCRIGDTADMMRRGRISYLNAPAQNAGIASATGCAEAAERLCEASPATGDRAPPEIGEGRGEIEVAGAQRRILLLDSAAMVRPEDAGQIVVTGSHGGLVGGVPAMALRTDGFAAVFNDAGIGIEEAGITRLPALDRRGIAALTVSSASARIGDARSSFEDGVVSRLNATAAGLGAEPGQPVREILLAWARRG